MPDIHTQHLAPYRQMAELLDTLHVGLCLFDETDRALLWNHAFLRLFPEHAGHIRVGEPYRDNLARFYRGRLNATELKNIEEYIASGIRRHRSQTMPFVFEHHGRWVKVASDPIPGIGRLRVWTPIARPDSMLSSQSGQDAMMPFLTDDGDAAIQSDAGHRIVRANSRFLQLFELKSEEEARGRSLSSLYADAWSRLSTDEEASRHWQLSLAEAERFCGNPFQLALPGDRWVRCLQKMMPDGGKLTTMADISDMKQLQRKLEEARNAAEIANRAKDHFLAIVSHELRTPMNGILGMLDLLNEEELDQHRSEKVEVARQSAQALLGLLDDILAFSRMASGRTELEWSATDPSSLIATTARLIEPRALKKGITLRWTVSPDVPSKIMVDPDRLRQVLLNILGNAVKFTEKGEVVLSAHMESPRPDGRPVLNIAVSDTGIGIPLTAQQRIFEPFVQADSRVGRRFGGTGLGLAICRQVVEAMGGSVSVQSTEGIGSRFSVTIPCDLPGDSAAIEAPKARRELPPLKILVVDDNAVNREVAKLLLERLGASATTVADGAAAVIAARQEPFDLILLDIEMPEMDGYQVAQAIRDTALVNAGTPIVALTAHSGEHFRALSRGAGMQGFITKPLRLASLADEIGSAIGA